MNKRFLSQSYEFHEQLRNSNVSIMGRMTTKWSDNFYLLHCEWHFEANIICVSPRVNLKLSRIARPDGFSVNGSQIISNISTTVNEEV